MEWSYNNAFNPEVQIKKKMQVLKSALNIMHQMRPGLEIIFLVSAYSFARRWVRKCFLCWYLPEYYISWLKAFYFLSY